MPNEFKCKYIDILLKHRSAISIGKHDLGRAKNFHHRIHLKDNSPVYRKQFKIPDSHHDFLTKEIAEWLKLGVVCRKLHYGESFDAERLQILQSDQKIAKQNINEKLFNKKKNLTKIQSPTNSLLVR